MPQVYLYTNDGLYLGVTTNLQKPSGKGIPVTLENGQSTNILVSKASSIVSLIGVIPMAMSVKGSEATLTLGEVYSKDDGCSVNVQLMGKDDKGFYALVSYKAKGMDKGYIVFGVALGVIVLLIVIGCFVAFSRAKMEHHVLKSLKDMKNKP